MGCGLGLGVLGIRFRHKVHKVLWAKLALPNSRSPSAPYMAHTCRFPWFPLTARRYVAAKNIAVTFCLLHYRSDETYNPRILQRKVIKPGRLSPNLKLPRISLSMYGCRVYGSGLNGGGGGGGGGGVSQLDLNMTLASMYLGPMSTLLFAMQASYLHPNAHILEALLI